MKEDVHLKHFGPIQLSEGVMPKHAMTFFLAAFFGICIVTFLNSAQPYLLTQLFDVPKDQQGAISGRLSGFQELIVILLAGPVGVLADRISRRSLYVVSYLILAVGFFIYPLSESIEGLYFGRLVFAIGVAFYAVALASLAADYPTNDSRGKFLAAQVIVTGLAIFIFAQPILGKLATWYGAMGFDVVTTSRYLFWTISCIAIMTAVICWFGLKPGLAVVTEQRIGFWVMLKEGFADARQSSPLALSYFAAFATRGDFVVITLFLSLWFSQAVTDPAKALADFYMRFGAIQVVALLWAPIMGFILDRIDRIKGVVLAMSLAAVAYTSLILVDDPAANVMWLCVVLLGIAETSTIMSGNALLGEYAPVKRRGSAVGAYTLLGGFGIFVASIVGGMVFSITPAGPFLFMAIINGLVAVAAVIIGSNVRAKSGIDK